MEILLYISGVRTSDLRVPNEFEPMIFAKCEFRTSSSFQDASRTEHPSSELSHTAKLEIFYQLLGTELTVTFVFIINNC